MAIEDPTHRAADAAVLPAARAAAHLHTHTHTHTHACSHTHTHLAPTLHTFASSHLAQLELRVRRAPPPPLRRPELSALHLVSLVSARCVGHTPTRLYPHAPGRTPAWTGARG